MSRFKPGRTALDTKPGLAYRPAEETVEIGNSGRKFMRSRLLLFTTIAVACLIGSLLGTRLMPVQGQEKPGAGFATIPGQTGGQDIFGAYEVVKDWPKPISGLPGNERWTWGAGQSVYAENPNRVFLLFRGELPNIPRPATKLLPDFGASVLFPI